MNKNSLIYTVIFSFIATFVLVFPLALANEATKPIVEQNRKLSDANGILTALGISYSVSDTDNILKLFADLDKFTLDGNKKLTQVSNQQLEQARKSGSPIFQIYYRTVVNQETRWAGTFIGPALWGNITLAIGVNSEVSQFKGLQVLAQVETPGLGARIGEPWFYNQFNGQAIPASGILRYKAGDGTGDQNYNDDVVDGVTGATLTTNGVRDLVNKSIADLKSILSGAVQ